MKKKTKASVSLFHKTVLDGIPVEVEIKATGVYVPEVYATQYQPGECAYFDEIEYEAVNFHPDHLNAVLDEIEVSKGIPVDYYASDRIVAVGEFIDPKEEDEYNRQASEDFRNDR
jgi:hypothetical protein